MRGRVNESEKFFAMINSCEGCVRFDFDRKKEVQKPLQWIVFVQCKVEEFRDLLLYATSNPPRVKIVVASNL
ncbi:hypothetical protein Metme_0788 [Methylomonas methanica MC09]|uniref:Uncharacterized protein n=1 Tax=Methylomonas methanica (strain DSM 25384 / MC09) TaxID=857087 RepID=G0A5V0_METMM|nr:hypothetical protein Metme_0788 [Methylomonas methanica MC09]